MGVVHMFSCLMTASVHAYAAWQCLDMAHSDMELEMRLAGALNFMICSLMVVLSVSGNNCTQIGVAITTSFSEFVCALVIIFSMIDRNQLTEKTMENTLHNLQEFGKGGALTTESTSFLWALLLLWLCSLHCTTVLCGMCCGGRTQTTTNVPPAQSKDEKQKKQ
ncbi:hypothetical protein SARC_03461 [Sphaeroforma arctica JP610]|uniref:Transmembrane protein 107 n=1 Tax=Sphaeroforma arctica JP610 TaxID=667725 RepID=A0A0L0G5J4_9EUKA|nr:hypothetical protein SARC_03461 [Sphaeroforma arctica JP610]KNC84300.1 hypothetical protein SARC_03461 [Sphaeroforma arctica JP610]|eukprot:XP_014158202.1 hypothetical protein SARC_03461 [Sphaeroforma arctica JP610]